MKTTYIKCTFLLTIFLFCVILVNAQTDNKLNNKIFKIQYDKYLDKEVFNLLLNDEIRYYENFTFFDDKPCVLTGAIIEINSTTYIEIYVSKFNHLNPFNETRKWDKMLFYKEKISRIKVYYNNKCEIDIGVIN
jgi:hypothetical protein